MMIPLGLNQNNFKKAIFLFGYIIIFLFFYNWGNAILIVERFLWLSVSSLMLFLTFHKLSLSNERSLFVIIWFISTPWIIEKAVRIGNIHYFTLLILTSVYLFVSTKHNFLKIAIVIFSILCGMFVYRDLWIYKSLTLPQFSKFIENLAKISSFDILFFRNSFVSANNAIGIFYPETIPLYLIGIYKFLTKNTLKKILFFTLPMIFLSGLSNEIWAGKDFFVFIPFMSIIFVIGYLTLYRTLWLHIGTIFSKLIFILYILFLLYGVINFQHYFIYHYLPNAKYL